MELCYRYPLSIAGYNEFMSDFSDLINRHIELTGCIPTTMTVHPYIAKLVMNAIGYGKFPVLFRGMSVEVNEGMSSHVPVIIQ